MSLFALCFGKRKKAVELKVAGELKSRSFLSCGFSLRAPNMGNHLPVLDMRSSSIV